MSGGIGYWSERYIAAVKETRIMEEQLRACKREKREMFAALCKGCRYHGAGPTPYCRQTNGDCTLRACPLLKGDKRCVR